MSSHSLTFQFAGICTHFRFGVVAGVPHRVVLPDASQFMTGLVTVQETPVINPDPVFYYTTPHFPQLELVSGSADLTIPGLMNDGDILTSVSLQVINATDREMSYLDDNVPALTAFVPNYNFASDVVLNGRAACYLDLHGGTQWTIDPVRPNGPRRLFIKVETDGPPELLVTSLVSSGRPGKSHRITLAKDGDPTDVALWLKNLEVNQERPAEERRGAYDFLLHFLTARGGIPQTIMARTPGMPTDIRSATPEELGQALDDLAHLLRKRTNPPSRLELIPPDGVTPSCADAHYP